MIWEVGGEIRRLPASIETPDIVYSTTVMRKQTTNVMYDCILNPLLGADPDNSERGDQKNCWQEHSSAPNPHHINILVKIAQYYS